MCANVSKNVCVVLKVVGLSRSCASTGREKWWSIVLWPNMVRCHHKMHFCNNPPPKNLLTQRDAQCKWPINIENHEQVCISNMHRFRSQQKWCWESRKGSKITGSCSFSGEFSDRDPVFLPFTHCGEFRNKKKSAKKIMLFFAKCQLRWYYLDALPWWRHSVAYLPKKAHLKKLTFEYS